MNVIFLDIDGVLNTYWIVNGDIKLNQGAEDSKLYNDQSIQYLNLICKEFKFKLVISSTWRKLYSLDKIKKFLYNSGLDKNIEIIGITPSSSTGYRGDDIDIWLKENPVNYFLIIDDDTDMSPYEDHLVQCESEIGLSMIEYQKIRHILNNI